jgi:hypothetical protein
MDNAEHPEFDFGGGTTAAGAEACSECGQTIKRLNPHVMCRQKVWMLYLLARGFHVEDEWVKPSEGREVRIAGQVVRGPYRSRAHASRLSWFGLAEKGEYRSGLFRITGKGLSFLAGRASVPAKIYCQEGSVVRASADVTHLQDVRGVVLDKAYWDNYQQVSLADLFGCERYEEG